MNLSTGQSPELDALLAHQRTISEKAAGIASIKAKIKEIEGEALKLDAAMPNVEALETERTEVLAAIAIGERSENDLEEIDARIAATCESSHPDCMSLGRAKETVAGLQRRVETETAALRELQSKSTMIVRRYLLAEAEAAGAEYAAAAVTMVAYYKRLNALDSLLADRGHRPRLHCLGPHLHVPSFELESCKVYGNIRTSNVLYEQPHFHSERLAWHAAELQRQREAGIDIAALIAPGA